MQKQFPLIVPIFPGKTGAFAIPVIQRILKMKKEATVTEQLTTALILAPSKELCQQIKQSFDELTVKCQRDVRTLDLASTTNINHSETYAITTTSQF